MIERPDKPQKQDNEFYCGPGALQLAFGRLGIVCSQDYLAGLIGTTEEEGTSTDRMIEAVRALDLQGLELIHASMNDLAAYVEMKLPVIVNYRELVKKEGHFSVVIEVTDDHVIVDDPEDPPNAPHKPLDRKEFEEHWVDSKQRFPRWMLVISKEPIPVLYKR